MIVDHWQWAFRPRRTGPEQWLAVELRASWGNMDCTQARLNAEQCLRQRNPLAKGQADTIDSEYVDGGCEKRTEHLSRM